MTQTAERCREFRQLHQSGCFVIPNPWDVGSARLLERLGFKALATTSAGFAWSLGRRDNQVTLEQALAFLKSVAEAVTVPVNADFEGGFAVEPAEVAANVRRAAGTGVAGLSIEDSTGDPAHPLFEFALAVERVGAARRAIDDSGAAVLLTGRSEGFISGRPDLGETIRRLVAYAAAGADCLYAPGVRDLNGIAAIVSAVAPKPVNVLCVPGRSVRELAEVGVRRISVGSGLARVAWAAALAAAHEIARDGTFTAIGAAGTHADIDRLFDAV
jgi:2-methylisocitrate lyase-like PEP mutase family enzyme